MTPKIVSVAVLTILLYPVMLNASPGAPADSGRLVNYYPLNVGDYHQYMAYHDGYGDSVLGKTYYIWDSKIIGGKTYYRSSSDSLSAHYIRTDSIGNLYRNVFGKDELIYRFDMLIDESFMTFDTFSFLGSTLIDTIITERWDHYFPVVSNAGRFTDLYALGWDVLGTFDDEHSVVFAANVGHVASYFPWSQRLKLYKAKVGDIYYPPKVGIIESEEKISNYSLHQNYPNPFNPVTEINYTLAKSAEITVVVYNILGNEVARLYSGAQSAGTHTLSWDASGVSGGIYFYRLVGGGFTQTRKMILLK